MRHSYGSDRRGARARALAAAVVLPLLLAAVPLSPALAAAQVAGTWLTESGNGKVRIAPCGDLPGAGGEPADQLCGAIVWLKEPLTEAGTPKVDARNPDAALQQRPIIGLPILTGFEPGDEPGVWEGGRIYNPEDGETYKSVITLKDDGARLEVRGYVGLPIFGKTQVWTRSE